MSIEIINDGQAVEEAVPFNPCVARETDEVNQIVWLKSSPVEVTSSPEPQSPEV